MFHDKMEVIMSNKKMEVNMFHDKMEVRMSNYKMEVNLQAFKKLIPVKILYEWSSRMKNDETRY